MVNPRKVGLQARYSWMATAEKETGNGPLQAIKRLDLVNGKSLTWSIAPRGFVSEPLMIPKSASTEEDDGWVLVLIWDGKMQESQLVVLKAKDLSHQATMRIPIKIPHGLHGSWVDSNKL